MANYSYQGGCPDHTYSAVVVSHEVGNYEKARCTLCNRVWWSEKGSKERLPLSAIANMFPDHWAPGTAQWAAKCEREHRGWYNPYQGDYERMNGSKHSSS